jgi:phosphate/sulfate permease
MLNLFTFWVLAPIVVIGYAYAIVSAVRGWHKYAYVPVERYTTLKQHAQELHDKYQGVQ